MLRFMSWLLPIGLLGGLIVLFVSWRAAVNHSAPAPSVVGSPPTDFPYPLESIEFRTRDGLTLRGWYGRAENERGTAVLLHAYRANRTQMLARARWYAEQGFSVLLYDARATGESEGDRISIGYHEVDDLTAALHWARQRGATRVVCHGISQGAATILLAAERLENVAAVVSESAYDTALNAVDRRFRNRVGLPGWLAGIFYRPFAELRTGVNARDIRPIDQIGKLACPVFILSGEEDRHTWKEDTLRLYEAAREPKKLWLVPATAHTDLHRADPETYEEKLKAFINAAVPAPEHPVSAGAATP